MASPVDIQCCYDAILSAYECKRLKLMDPEEFKEIKMTLKAIARKYADVCMKGNLRAEDVD